MSAVMPLPKDYSHDESPAQAEQVVLVTGAGKGIGLALVTLLLGDDSVTRIFAASRSPEQSRELTDLAEQDSRLELLTLDPTDPASIQQATRQMSAPGRLDLVINTVGVLHSPSGLQPEKRLNDINFDDMLLAFDVNALSMMRLAMELQPLVKGSRKPKFVSLSARVGSIEDNRLGGWYAYRASKAALNMLLRTLAIEWSRSMPTITCAALHPGTVATDLSAPFTKNTRGVVFTPVEAAERILNVIDQLDAENNGQFIGWDGKVIPW
ncbi:MAG: SDR family NAD(P)-dependent oxidoreductase [Gammaproteobacteria bacterium]